MKPYKHIAENVKDWVRIEAEYSGVSAHQLTERLKLCSSDTELKNVLISAILDKYMFFYTASNKPHKVTKLMLELLDEKNFQFTSLSTRNSALDASIEHLKRSSGLYPTLWKAKMIWGENADVELLEYLYTDYLENFNPSNDHVSWFNRHYSTMVTQDKYWAQKKEVNYEGESTDS